MLSFVYTAVCNIYTWLFVANVREVWKLQGMKCREKGVSRTVRHVNISRICTWIPLPFNESCRLYLQKVGQVRSKCRLMRKNGCTAFWGLCSRCSLLLAFAMLLSLKQILQSLWFSCVKGFVAIYYRLTADL